MQYRTLGTTGLKVSEIGFGGEWMDGTLEETLAVTRACEDAGINILDCWMPDPTRRITRCRSSVVSSCGISRTARSAEMRGFR